MEIADLAFLALDLGDGADRPAAREQVRRPLHRAGSGQPLDAAEIKRHAERRGLPEAGRLAVMIERDGDAAARDARGVVPGGALSTTADSRTKTSAKSNIGER